MSFVFGFAGVVPVFVNIIQLIVVPVLQRVTVINQCPFEYKALLARRELHREYLALVEGRPSARTGTIRWG